VTADGGRLHPVIDDEQKARLYARGVAHFDHGRYFEAHEPWETIWRSRNPEPRDLYQGLVQVAAGFHHWFAHGRAGAAIRLLERGARRLEAIESGQLPGNSAGGALDLAVLCDQVRAWIGWLASREGVPPPPPSLSRR
jgi:hypothetical protein